MDWFASFRGHRAFWLPKMTREVVVLCNAVLLVGGGVWGFSGVGGIGGSQFIFFGKQLRRSQLKLSQDQRAQGASCCFVWFWWVFFLGRGWACGGSCPHGET